MENNFRNVLIILSAIIIGAIFIHGLWTIRKQKNPYKLKTKKEKVGPLSRDFDRKGFDQDGVGQVKVITHPQDNVQSSDATEYETFQSKSEGNDDFLAESLSINTENPTSHVGHLSSETAETIENPYSKKTPKLDDNYHSAITELSLDGELSPLGDELIEDENKSSQESRNEKKEPKIELVAPPTVKPLYREPVSRPKPIQAKPANKQPLSKAVLKRNQMEINFGKIPQVEDELMPSIHIESEKIASSDGIKTSAINNTHSSATEQIQPPEPQVIILSVVMPANQYMSGASLLPSLLTLGMKFGEMNIFHRHQDNAGNGPVTFSLANIMNPGSFDLDTMETFATQGVSLFMTLPNKGESLAVFEQMLGSAKHLAQEFNAQVVDDKRNILTKQTEQHYVGKIREFDRKNRIAQAK